MARQMSRQSNLHNIFWLIYDNNLRKLSKRSVENLCKFHGFGLAKATRLTAAFGLVRRHEQSSQERVQLNSSQSVFDFLQPHLENLQHE